jgi:DNA-binding GntR family transcriptional regulator
MSTMPIPDSLARIVRPSARTLVFEQLRDWIESGALASGEIIKDVEIAQRLGVSRTPVREALQLLEQMGAVETIPNHYTRVTCVDPGDAALVYPPLTVLVAMATELATPHATADDLRGMERANEQMLAAARRGEPSVSREMDTEFHLILTRRANNPYLANAIDTLLMHARRLDTAYFAHVDRSQASYDEHREIIAAVTARDAAHAAQLVKRHYEQAKARADAPEKPSQDGPGEAVAALAKSPAR